MSDYAHFKSMMDQEYLGSWAFAPGEKRLLTIKSVKEKVITRENGKKERRPVIEFVEPSLLFICNVTNGNAISELAGTPNAMRWPGTRIVLAVERVKAKAGGMTDGLRVQMEESRAAAEAGKVAVCADCGQTIRATSSLTAIQVAQGTQERYGRALCAACGTAAKEAEIRQEANNAEA